VCGLSCSEVGWGAVQYSACKGVYSNAVGWKTDGSQVRDAALCQEA